ncbi:NUDIX domain-containing protein [Candidatus Marsarchaeota archaeon]|nr:NUDIX domain-containing protein [Candidatus Marsarchaeota archaeon]
MSASEPKTGQNAKLPVIAQLSTGAVLCVFMNGKANIVLLAQNAEFYHKSTNDMDVGPSGMMEGSDPVASAKREIKEETGLEPEVDTGFCEGISYEFDAAARSGPHKGSMAHIKKTRRYYLARISEDDLKRIRLSEEHISWQVLPIDEALKLSELKEDQKKLLLKLKAYLGAP